MKTFTVRVYHSFPPAMKKRAEFLEMFTITNATIDGARDAAQARVEGAYKNMRLSGISIQPPGDKFLAYIQDTDTRGA